MRSYLREGISSEGRLGSPAASPSTHVFLVVSKRDFTRCQAAGPPLLRCKVAALITLELRFVCHHKGLERARVCNYNTRVGTRCLKGRARLGSCAQTSPTRGVGRWGTHRSPRLVTRVREGVLCHWSHEKAMAARVKALVCQVRKDRVLIRIEGAFRGVSEVLLASLEHRSQASGTQATVRNIFVSM